MTFSTTEQHNSTTTASRQESQIEVWTATFTDRWPEWFCQKLLQFLAVDDQKNILKFRRWQDRQLKLLGRALLMKALVHRDYSDDAIKTIIYSPNGKPGISGAPQFNISHSGARAVCAIGNESDIGVDIELYREIELRDFQLALSPEEDNHLRNSPRMSRQFLELWTQKESICKAQGGGLSINLKSVCPENGKAQINDQTYFIKEVNIAPDYLCSIATRNAYATVSVIHQDIDPQNRYIL